MTADEARALSEANEKNDLVEINTLIEAAATRGEWEIRYPVEIKPETIKQLMSDGFEVFDVYKNEQVIIVSWVIQK